MLSPTRSSSMRQQDRDNGSRPCPSQSRLCYARHCTSVCRLRWCRETIATEVDHPSQMFAGLGCVLSSPCSSHCQPKKREKTMSRAAIALLASVLGAAALPAYAQAPTPPLFSTTKVEGTDGVYIFRYQGHQA